MNTYLKSYPLISESGATVSVDAVKRDGYEKIDHDEKMEIAGKTRDAQREINEIDAMITAIDNILEDKRQ